VGKGIEVGVLTGHPVGSTSVLWLQDPVSLTGCHLVADNIDFQDILSMSLLHSALCYPSITFVDYSTLRSLSYQASFAAYSFSFSFSTHHGIPEEEGSTEPRSDSH
jgi:hypothetical protein